MLKRILILLIILCFIMQVTLLFSKQPAREDMAKRERDIALEEKELELREREFGIRRQHMELNEHEKRLEMHERIQEKKHDKMMKDLKAGKFPKMEHQGRKHWKGSEMKKQKEFFEFIFLCMLIIRILLLIVVTRDFKLRQNISIIWIFIVLIGGLPAALVYALFCISHKKA